jgi:hypothetical protein
MPFIFPVPTESMVRRGVTVEGAGEGGKLDFL